MCAVAAACALLAGMPVEPACAAQAGAPSGLPPGPTPTHASISYAPADPAGSAGHLLDLYLPASPTAPVPVVIWTGGSAWMATNGRETARWLAAQLVPAGFAVAGVSIRSSADVKFPGQLHDIKAAIRWLRANASKYGLDGARIGIAGDSSGGWTASMAATTGDVPGLEGAIGVSGVSSAVQAAVAFYPPTDFLQMDAWALERCDPSAKLTPGTRPVRFCHDAADSPESRLVGCAIQSCADVVRAADPARYVSAADPPMLILHGESDPLVPHAQGERLYVALSHACHDATFVSLPRAGHGSPWSFLTDATVNSGATIRSTSAAGCAVKTPEPYTPSYATVVDFFRRHLGR